MYPQQSTKISQIKYKIIFLGQMMTGKTSIIQQFTKSRFDEGIKSTVGFDLITKNICFKSYTYKLQLWDTAGQQKYRSLVPNYLHGSHCAVFVYDITDEKSFQSLMSWLQLYKNNQSQDSIGILVGNKSDKNSQRKVTREMASQWAKKYQMAFIQVSAKTGQGIEDIFYSIIENIDPSEAITSCRQLLVSQDNKIIQEAKQTDRSLNQKNEPIKIISLNASNSQKDKSQSIKLNKNTKLKLGQKKKQFACCYI